MSAVLRRRGAVLGLAAALAVGFGACSADKPEGDAAALSAADRRYCELASDVEALAGKAFSGLGEGASEEETAEVQRRLLEDVDDELDQMVQVAPSEIAGDVRAYVAFFRAQMRGEEAEEVSDERIVRWEEQNCPNG